jgi:hypothetical protein
MDASQASHVNLMRFSALATELDPNGEVVDSGDEILFRDPHPFAFASGAMRSHARLDGAGLIDRADELIAGRDYVVHVRDDAADAPLDAAAEAAGLALVAERYPAMGAERPLEPVSVPGLVLREVADEGDAREFWRICGASFPEIGFPADYFDGPPSATITDPRSASILGELEGEAVASAMATVIGEVAFVGWVGTAPAARGRGIGAAVTVAATNAALARGAKLASLQSSAMGESVYRRIGYRELFNYRLWARQRR